MILRSIFLKGYIGLSGKQIELTGSCSCLSQPLTHVAHLGVGLVTGMLVLENAQCLAKSACDFSGMLQAKLNRRSI